MKRNQKLPASKRKKVFTNYPVYDKKLGSTLQWLPEYADHVIRDSFVVIDEAYRDYNSRNSTTKGSFTANEHLMFSTNGHNGNDFLLLVQNPARLETIIREMCNMVYFVKKYTLPFSTKPIAFKVESYMSLEEMSKRFSKNNEAVYGIERYLFSKRVAQAYDTHYFRKRGEPDIQFQPWNEVMNDFVSPLDPVNLDNGSCFNSLNLKDVRLASSRGKKNKKSPGKFGFFIFMFLVIVLYTYIWGVLT